MKQLYWFLIGFAVLFLTTTFDYHLLERLAYPFYFFTLALLMLVYLIGGIISGSQRWLSVGGISIQPSELCKIALIILLARYFNEHFQIGGYRLRDLWRPFLWTGLPCLLILKQPDLGTALIVLDRVVHPDRVCQNEVEILPDPRGLTAILAAPFLWFHLKEYQQKRILTFLNPEMDPLGAGYHINQSKIAIGSGLLWGKGYPERNPDAAAFPPGAAHRLCLLRAGRGVGLRWGPSS